MALFFSSSFLLKDVKLEVDWGHHSNRASSKRCVSPSFESDCHRSIHQSVGSMQLLLKGLHTLKMAGIIFERKKTKSFSNKNHEKIQNVTQQRLSVLK